MSIYHFEQSQHLLPVVAMHLTSLLVMMFELDSDEKKKKNPFGCEISPTSHICSYFSSGKQVVQGD